MYKLRKLSEFSQKLFVCRFNTNFHQALLKYTPANFNMEPKNPPNWKGKPSCKPPPWIFHVVVWFLWGGPYSVEAAGRVNSVFYAGLAGSWLGQVPGSSRFMKNGWNMWAMIKNHSCLGYIGDYTTKIYPDYFIRIPIKQPGFNGKYPAVVFFRGSCGIMANPSK